MTHRNRKIIILTSLCLFSAAPAYGTGTRTLTQACPEKLEIYLSVDDKNLRPSEITQITITEIKKSKLQGREYDYVKVIGRFITKDYKEKFPNVIKVDVEKLDYCPFLTEIRFEGDTARSLALKFISPAITGKAYAVLLQPVHLTIRNGNRF